MHATITVSISRIIIAWVLRMLHLWLLRVEIGWLHQVLLLLWSVCLCLISWSLVACCLSNIMRLLLLLRARSWRVRVGTLRTHAIDQQVVCVWVTGATLTHVVWRGGWSFCNNLWMIWQVVLLKVWHLKHTLWASEATGTTLIREDGVNKLVWWSSWATTSNRSRSKRLLVLLLAQ